MPETGAGVQEQPPRQIQEIKTVTEVPFPEDPQARFEAIFAAIGNSETKCSTLLCLQDFPMGMSDLHRQYLRVTKNAYKTDTRVQADYSRKTLAPIGMVAQVDTLFMGSSEFVTGYRITDAGKSFGKPIAAYLLQQSMEFEKSLDKLFGITSKSGGEKRPVINRIKILDYLYKNLDPTRKPSLAEVIKDAEVLRESVSEHIDTLVALGLVEYSGWNNETLGAIKYSATEDAADLPFRQYGTALGLTIAVRNIALELGTTDAYEVLKIITERYPEIHIKSHPAMRIGNILMDLSKQGILTRKFDLGKVTSARLTDEGIKIMEKIILPIQRALTPQGEDLLVQWRTIPWQEYAPEAISKYKEQSANANSRPIQESASDVLEIILDNPGIRPSEIEKRIGHNTGAPLKLLLLNGLIRKGVDPERKTAVRYYST